MSKKPKKKTPDDGLTEGETRKILFLFLFFFCKSETNFSSLFFFFKIGFIESTISVYATEQALFKGWIQVAFASEKKLASGPIEKVIKFQKRILVVGKYRIFLIERGTVRGKKSVRKNFQIKKKNFILFSIKKKD